MMEAKKTPRATMSINATEKRLTRRDEDTHEELVETMRTWLTKHHGPFDAVYVLCFLEGDCEHPYHVTVTAPSEPGRDFICDLCGAE